MVKIWRSVELTYDASQWLVLLRLLSRIIITRSLKRPIAVSSDGRGRGLWGGIVAPTPQSCVQ